MIARGNTREILKKVGQIQNIVGEAKGINQDDQHPLGAVKIEELLAEALDLCIEIRGMYDPVD